MMTQTHEHEEFFSDSRTLLQRRPLNEAAPPFLSSLALYSIHHAPPSSPFPGHLFMQIDNAGQCEIRRKASLPAGLSR